MASAFVLVIEKIFLVVASVPVLIVTAIFVWSWYAYNITLVAVAYLPYIPAVAVIFMIVQTATLVLVLWSFLTATLTNPGHPPSKFDMRLETFERLFPPGSEVSADRIRQELGDDTVLIMRRHDGLPRYCVTCQKIKPDRAHHCSQCDKCIMRMDHHCVFINNCVGYRNHKAFYLFVSYGFLYTIWIFLTALPAVVQALQSSTGSFKSMNFQWVILIVLSFMFTLVLLFFTITHTRIILGNRTSVEMVSEIENVNRKWLYDVDRAYNWREFMGDNPWLWALPITQNRRNGHTYSRFADLEDDQV